MVEALRYDDLCTTMNWISLTETTQLDAIDEASRTRPVLIFKHSTSCSISRTALDRLQRAWTKEDNAGHAVYLLDLLKFRAVSDAVAERYGITHESPQTLVIQEGKCDWSASHFSITYSDTVQALAA